MGYDQDFEQGSKNKAQLSQDNLFQIEQDLLDAALLALPRHSRWDEALIQIAAKTLALDPGLCHLLLPHGPKDLAALLSRRHDQKSMEELAKKDPLALKIRERIALAVRTRIRISMEDEAAVRRSLAFFIQPGNLGLAGRLLWTTADQIWIWAGDQATDFNHYSKRALLSGILATTLQVRLNQTEAQAEQHLSRCIEGVMTFEKWKSSFLKPASAKNESP